MKGTTRLRQLLSQSGMLVAPGAHDVMSARIVEAEGFDAVYLGGFAASASSLGIPDHSLITMTELLAQARNVAALFFVSPGDSLEQVRAQFEPSMMHYFRTIGEQARLGGRGQYDGSYQYLQQVRERAAKIGWNEAERTMGTFGSPDDCIRRINEIYDGAHINQLVCWFNPGGRIPHSEVMAAMERFAAKVMPAVRPLGQ